MAGSCDYGRGAKVKRSRYKRTNTHIGVYSKSQLKTAIMHNIALTVYTLEGAEAVSKAAQEAGIKAKIHIKLDTGMGRLGFLPTEKSISIYENI